MNRLEIRKIIQKAGKEFYKSIKNNTLQNIAGEFMALNEEYILNHLDWDQTFKAVAILKEGFSENQKRWIKMIDRGD